VNKSNPPGGKKRGIPLSMPMVQAEDRFQKILDTEGMLNNNEKAILLFDFFLIWSFFEAIPSGKRMVFCFRKRDRLNFIEKAGPEKEREQMPRSPLTALGSIWVGS
jgi:hypothetical protein